MAAASRGAAEVGGHVVGVTCDTLSSAGRRTNPWVKEEIRRPTVRDRLLTLCRMADAAVALDGGIGTLSEIAFFASQIQTGELTPRPLLLLGEVWKSILREFFHSADDYLTDEDRAIFQFASSPAEAVKIIENHERRMKAS
jgi:predicted Rossmann-fold nucleotide-binding protein